jgi:hypothetical protein
VTMRNGVSLMPNSIYHHPPRRQASKAPFLQAKNRLTNAAKWCFFPAVKHENHVCQTTEDARARRRLHGHWAARPPQ